MKYVARQNGTHLKMTSHAHMPLQGCVGEQKRPTDPKPLPIGAFNEGVHAGVSGAGERGAWRPMRHQMCDALQNRSSLCGQHEKDPRI